MKTIWILSAFAVVFANHSLAQATEWEQTGKTDDGITTFRKEVPGSDIIAFRGEGDVNAPLTLIASIVFDCTRGTEWVDDLKESHALHKDQSQTLDFVEYDHVGTPFVMKDRDFVSLVTTRVDPANHSMTIKSVDDPSAPKTTFIRGEMVATFIFTAVGSGKDQKTHVLADIHCDPKGSVAKWIVNFFQKDWPVTTFRNLRKQALKADIKIDPRFLRLFKESS
jgi:hypothetical protein